MKLKSHRMLGQHLADQYLGQYPARHVRAFLLGCVEPDRNPTTYLKGSIRSQWLRGHNWDNAQHYMQRTAKHLERRQPSKMLDFYRLGKLIHYTTDAFTLAHNAHFQEDLHSHVKYEIQLQEYFHQYMEQQQDLTLQSQGSAMDTIQAYHEDYVLLPGCVHTDAQFTYNVCSLVVSLILPATAIVNGLNL